MKSLPLVDLSYRYNTLDLEASSKTLQIDRNIEFSRYFIYFSGKFIVISSPFVQIDMQIDDLILFYLQFRPDV